MGKLSHPVARWLAALGIVCALIAAALAFLVPKAEVPIGVANPLAPPATDSPRATLTALTTELDAAQSLMVQAYREHVNERGWFMSPQTAAKQNLIEYHLNRAARTLNLEATAPVDRHRVGLETTILLSEIFDRVGLPPKEQIPDSAATKNLPSWTVPGTEIRISRVASGERAGEFLFSPDTVQRAYSYYKQVRFIAPHDGFDFYAFYAHSPGELIPPKWYSWIEALPGWFHEVYIDNARWQWIALGLTIFLGVSFCFLVHWINRPGGRASKHFPLWARDFLLPASVMAVVLLARSFVEEVNFTGPVAAMLASAFEVIFYLPATWLTLTTFNRVAEFAASWWAVRGYDLDAGILNLTIRAVGIVAATMIVAYGATQIGVPLAGVLAGLGVGGLAFALAAQPTMENLISGIMIYADRPVRVGQKCKVGAITGIVEEIGIRSTRIRAADRTLATVSNSDFAKAQIVNLSNRDRQLFATEFGLNYGPPASQIRGLLEQMRVALRNNPNVIQGTEAAELIDLGPSAFVISAGAELSGEAAKNAKEELLFGLISAAEKVGVQITAH
jgi:MscS family membrane protein